MHARATFLAATLRPRRLERRAFHSGRGGRRCRRRGVKRMKRRTAHLCRHTCGSLAIVSPFERIAAEPRTAVGRQSDEEPPAFNCATSTFGPPAFTRLGGQPGASQLPLHKPGRWSSSAAPPAMHTGQRPVCCADTRSPVRSLHTDQGPQEKYGRKVGPSRMPRRRPQCSRTRNPTTTRPRGER